MALAAQHLSSNGLAGQQRQLRRQQQRPAHVAAPRRPRFVVVASSSTNSSSSGAAAATTTTTAATTAAPSWLQRLIPGRPRQAKPAGGAVRVVNAEELAALLQARRDEADASAPLLVVLFSATWCGPCKLLQQRLEAVATRLGPAAVQIVKVDTDADPALATRLRISKLPTTFFCGSSSGSSGSSSGSDGNGGGSSSGSGAGPAVRMQGLLPEAVVVDFVADASKRRRLGSDLDGAVSW